MKILYDHQAFTYQRYGGVSKCFCELLRHRPEGFDYDISVVESSNYHLAESGLKTDVKPTVRTFQQFAKAHSHLGREKLYKILGRLGLLHTSEVANAKISIAKLKEGNFDVFHPTFFDNYFMPYLNGKPFVITVHDLMPELFCWRKEDPQIANKPELLAKASAIIAVSENTKTDLCRLYNVPSEKVHVVYHGSPGVLFATPEDIIGDPYFLYVGGRGGYKNFRQTLCDFAVCCSKHPGIKLVCTGEPLNSEELQLAESLGMCNNVKTLFATDNEMKSLYAHAIAFIFPSLYEGFGMPILEAYACGCPVLLNNKSCFPEIGADAALYFDSNDSGSDLPDKMEEILGYNEIVRTQLINKGYDRLKLFSWERSSQQLLEIYKNLTSPFSSGVRV